MTGPVSVHQGLRWGGGVAIVAIAVTRCVITFAPRVVFDVDPSIDATPLAGLGPAGSLVLDALLLAACGAALLGETLSKRGLDWWLLAAALLPVPAVIGHALMDSEDLWRGGTWMAAATACAVVAHLGRQRFMRIVLLALLAAVLAPVAVRGMTQVSISWAGVEWVGPEHGQTLAQFEANRDVFFADRGWAPDSAAAMIYERRLRQADPRGWFPTANLFASMMAFGTVLLAGLTIGAVRQRVGRGWPAALAPGALVIAGALLLAGSKGAIGAAGIGLALLAAPLAGDRARTFLARYGGVTTIGLVAAALLAVVVRGAVLPESWLGEQSLLFRWHYLVGAARVFADQGLMGVGPDGFQAAYAAHRLPTSPEEITSAHNMFADWLTTLGILGIGWVVLVLLLTWRAGVRVDSDSGEDADTSSGQARRWGRIALLTSAAVAVFGLMPALAFEAASFSGVGTEIARGAGIVGFVAAASVLVMVMVRLSAAVVTWTLTAAAVALVVHGQIEMTLFDPGCVTWAFTPPPKATRRLRRSRFMASRRSVRFSRWLKSLVSSPGGKTRAS